MPVLAPADPMAPFPGGSTPLRLPCVLPVGGQARTPDGAVLTPPWAR